jgi:hypothetical protein
MTTKRCFFCVLADGAKENKERNDLDHYFHIIWTNSDGASIHAIFPVQHIDGDPKSPSAYKEKEAALATRRMRSALA